MRNAQNPAMLVAVTAGLLTGAYMGARRPNRRSNRYQVALQAAPAKCLPVAAPRVAAEPVAPVVIDARFEEPRKRMWFPWAVAALAIFALLATAASTARPRFVALATPATVLAGSAATISYTTSGIGTASFTSNDGGAQRSGHLAKDGSITLPTSPKSHELIAVLQMQNAFGSDARVVHIRVVPMPAPVVHVKAADTPAIREFRLSKTSAQGGQTIAAAFESNAFSGSVRLVDAAGAVWLSRAVRSTGSVEFTVPLMHRDTPFIVVFHAERNNRAIEASAGFIAQAKSGTRAVSHPLAQHFSQPSFTIPAVVRAGSSFAIAVPAHLSGVSVSLSSSDGTGLAGPVLQRGGTVRIVAPGVSAPQQTFASISFQSGKQRETLIRKVLVVP